jgi:LGFP repeat
MAGGLGAGAAGGWPFAMKHIVARATARVATDGEILSGMTESYQRARDCGIRVASRFRGCTGMGLLRTVLAGGLLSLLTWGDTLVLKDGKKYTGVFVSGTATRIRFRTGGKTVRVFPTRDVARLEIGTKVADNAAPTRIPAPAAQGEDHREAMPPPASTATETATAPAPQPKAAEPREPLPVAAPLSPLTDMNRTTPLGDTGAVDGVYTARGGPAGVLGRPAAEEHRTTDGRAAVRQFANGFIYWTAQGGAHAIYGPIVETWIQGGGERSPLGYPTSDEEDTSGGYSRYQRFEHGSISWNPQDGARIQMNP